MSWKQQIEAQIAALHDAAEECDSGEADFYTGAAVDQAADAMQALLDVAVAASKLDDGFYSHEPDYFQAHYKLVEGLSVELDKLREAGDGS